MDFSDPNWWAKRRLLYNILLVVAGVAAFVAMATVHETVCADDPDREITIFTIAFQAVGYLIVMGIANIFYGIGPASERLFRPQNLPAYRFVTFSLGTVVSCAVPLLAPLGLIVACNS